SAATAKGIRLKRVFMDGQNGYDEGVWILDRMGALAPFYGLADAVFVGGSLVPVGGHNPVEPAYFAKPVLFGPWTNNFLEMSQLFLDQNAAIRVRDAGELKEKLIFLSREENARLSMGQRAQKLVSEHRGAL